MGLLPEGLPCGDRIVGRDGKRLLVRGVVEPGSRWEDLGR